MNVKNRKGKCERGKNRKIRQRKNIGQNMKGKLKELQRS